MEMHWMETMEDDGDNSEERLPAPSMSHIFIGFHDKKAFWG